MRLTVLFVLLLVLPVFAQEDDPGVIVFTSSQNPSDKQLFNSMGIELIVKPSNMVYMNNIANRFVGFCKD